MGRSQSSSRMERDVMASQKLTKHEIKTKETRKLLLQAAEKVFVRDGYEKADLAEIAELAGRTKGAIYGQFKSKEEVFLALVERHALHRRAEMRRRIEGSTSREQTLAIMREDYLSSIGDETWGLLLLEFRLYTIRHPDVRERLAELYKAILLANAETSYTAIIGPAGKGRDAIKRSTAIHVAYSMLYALEVEMRFEPSGLDKKTAKAIAGKIFDTLFES